MIRLIPGAFLFCFFTIGGCVTVPEPEPDAVAGPAAAQPEARQILLRMVDAMGGRTVWAETQTMEFELTAQLFNAEGASSATSLIVFRMPGQMYRGNQLEGVGEINMLVREEDVWFKPHDQDSLAPASPAVAEYVNAGLWRDLPFLLTRIARGGDEFTVEHVREERVGVTRYHVVEVRPPGDLPGYHLYLDATSALPLKRVFTQGSDAVEDVFSDFRDEAGRIIPRAVRSYRGGELAEDIVYTEVRFNTAVNTRLFDVG